MTKVQNPKLSTSERVVDDLSEKIVSYMDIVKKTTLDMIPKAIEKYIIQELKQFVDTGLLALIFIDSNDDEYVRSTDNQIQIQI